MAGHSPSPPTEHDLLPRARRMVASHALSKPKARRMGWSLTDAPETSSWQAIRHPAQTEHDLLPRTRRMGASHALSKPKARRTGWLLYTVCI